jgi:hypothetical protein
MQEKGRKSLRVEQGKGFQQYADASQRVYVYMVTIQDNVMYC